MRLPEKKKFKIAKENTWRGKAFRIFLKIIIAPLVRTVWIKKISGLENLPAKGSFIIAANHQSYFDFICLFCVLPFEMSFLAAEKFFSSKFWKPIMDYTGQIKVERDSGDKSESMTRAIDALKHERILGIFPQGTRSRTGEIKKTYTGVAKIALETEVLVIPVGIVGAYEVMPPHAKKPKFKKIIKINIGKPISFEKYYNQIKTPEIYRQATNEVVLEFARLSGKKYNPEK